MQQRVNVQKIFRKSIMKLDNSNGKDRFHRLQLFQAFQAVEFNSLVTEADYSERRDSSKFSFTNFPAKVTSVNLQFNCGFLSFAHLGTDGLIDLV